MERGEDELKEVRKVLREPNRKRYIHFCYPLANGNSKPRRFSQKSYN